MEKNIAIIDIEKYNKLRDFKKSIEAKEVCVLGRVSILHGIVEEWGFITTEKLNAKIIDENKTLVQRNKQLESKILEVIKQNHELSNDIYQSKKIYEQQRINNRRCKTDVILEIS